MTAVLLIPLVSQLIHTKIILIMRTQATSNETGGTLSDKFNLQYAKIRGILSQELRRYVFEAWRTINECR